MGGGGGVGEEEGGRGYPKTAHAAPTTQTLPCTARPCTGAHVLLTWSTRRGSSLLCATPARERPVPSTRAREVEGAARTIARAGGGGAAAALGASERMARPPRGWRGVGAGAVALVTAK